MSQSEQRAIDAGSFISGLSRTLAAANGYLVERMHAAGLENLVPSHGDILIQLFDHDGMSMQELSAKIGRDPSTVTALVKKLVDIGYVQTKKSDKDKRRIEVSLTHTGRGFKKEFESISRDLVKIQMLDIDSDDFEATCRTLIRIKKNFSEAILKESEE